MIHYLHHGVAPCMGRLTGLPKDWPQGHLWSGRWEDVNCAPCLEHQEAYKPTYMPSKIVNAPFNRQQQLALRRWQKCKWVHPFTCCGKQMWVFKRGFFCKKCKTFQTWCHDFMLKPPPRRLLPPLQGNIHTQIPIC